MKHLLNEPWTADVVGKLHFLNLSLKDLSKASGYSVPYLSTVLNGKKKFLSEDSKEKTKANILISLRKLEASILEGIK